MSDIKLKIEKYRPNSLIFIEGNTKIESFYIIRSGQIQTSRIHDVADDTNSEILKQGDTFGVVSCLANRPRIETIKTLTPVEIIEIKREQLIPLAQKNTPVIMKILRSFSQKLRNFDASITRLTLKKPVTEDIKKIKEIADYYYLKKQYKEAYITYKKYVHYNPDAPDLQIIKKNMQTIEQLKINLDEYEQKDFFTRIYKDKAMLFCEHEPGDELFIIQEGKVKISKIVGDQELLLAVLEAGDIIGEMAILENKPRNASAIAFGTLSTLIVNKSNFLNMVKQKPEIAHKILSLLSERIWVAYRQLENITIKDEYKRLLDALMIQLEKQKINLNEEITYNTGLGTNEILKLIGLNQDQSKGEELVAKLINDTNFKLTNNNIIINNLKDFSQHVESIRKFNLKAVDNK